MSNDLHRLVYYSRNKIAGDENAFSNAVGGILAASRTNNSQVSVTGALMFNSGCFAQVLEGPLDEVETTFERIQQDERHSDVSLLMLAPIEKRCFENWSMAFVGAKKADAERYGAIGAISGFDPSRMTGERIHEILHELTLQEESAAA